MAVTASICFSGTRNTLPVDPSSSSAIARCSSSQWEPAAIAAMPSSTSAGVFGMTRTTAVPAGRRASRKSVVMPAASETTSWPGRTSPPISSSSAAHVLRLHDQGEGVGTLGRLEVGDHGDGVLLLELAGALGALLPHQQLGDRPPGADQAGQQGLAHDAGPEDACDVRRRGHGIAYFLEIRDRTKNVRFCGRSASRLMR